MEMQQVRYFLALSRTLNFTRAAEAANVSQPALTRAIQQLEHELGGPLFHRERGNTHLSELGRIMLPYLEAIQTQTEAARKHARSLQRLETATLRIGAMCTIGPAVLSDLLIRFQADFPNVEVVVSDDSSAGVLDALRDGDVDAAIVGAMDEADERFHALSLFRERFVVAVAKDHPFAAKNVVEVQDLHGQDYVRQSRCEAFEAAARELVARGIRPKKVFSSDRDDWVQGMVRAGLGFAFLPEMCVSDPGLVVRRLVEPEFVRTIMLATVRGRPHSPAVGAFVRAARAFAWPQPPLEADAAVGRQVSVSQVAGRGSGQTLQPALAA